MIAGWHFQKQKQLIDAFRVPGRSPVWGNLPECCSWTDRNDICWRGLCSQLPSWCSEQPPQSIQMPTVLNDHTEAAAKKYQPANKQYILLPVGCTAVAMETSIMYTSSKKCLWLTPLDIHKVYPGTYSFKTKTQRKPAIFCATMSEETSISRTSLHKGTLNSIGNTKDFQKHCPKSKTCSTIAALPFMHRRLVFCTASL